MEKASKTPFWGAQLQLHCRQQRCRVFYDTKGTKCGQGHAVPCPHRHWIQRCSAPLPTAISLSASHPSLPMLASQGPTAGTHLSCPTKLPVASSGAAQVPWEQAQGSWAELTTEHGVGWDPGVQPPPHPSASPLSVCQPLWGHILPMQRKGGSRLAEGHQGHCAPLPGHRHQARSPDRGGCRGSVHPLWGGSGGRTQSQAGPARLRCRALG